jgi:hypothetical protein
MGAKGYIYVCVFEWDRKDYATTSERGIQEFKDGFWVNASKQLALGDDNVYWIPPSAIGYIHKVRVTP